MMQAPQHPFSKAGDIESGNQQLYPMMMESPQLRWAFIRKVYMILSIQLLLTVAVGSVVVTVPEIQDFFVHTSAGFAVYMICSLSPIIVLCPLYCYRQSHPLNLILLGVFTVCMSLPVGLACSFRSGKVVLEAAILTAVVFVSLTIYTFWAAKRGHDFSFLGPFLFGASLVLMVFGLLQIFFPFGKITITIYAGLAAILFCGYIVYDTDNLIKRFSYDEYVWAAVSLYIDIINLFVMLLTLLDDG